GPSEFGPATGKPVRAITIADCACRENQIFEEWLVRDYAGIAQQLGMDVADAATGFAEVDVRDGTDILASHRANMARLRAGAIGSDLTGASTADHEALVRRWLKALWHGGDLEALKQVYDFRVGARYPGARDLYGPDQVLPVVQRLTDTLSDIQTQIDHLCAVPYLGEGLDVAVRWSLVGTHAHDGAYGAPLNRDLYVLGISHLRIIRGRIREEVTIWDDLALRRMIEGARIRGAST
ncbi:MAG: ester cyclase, partial [Pseudomonadota bacterium]